MSTEPTFTLSGFGDEIDPDLDTQLELLSEEGLSHLDLRSVEGTNVLDLSAEQVAAVHDTLDEHGFEVACIGSPIGKVGIEDDFEAHLERFRTAVETAHEFDTEYVRLFSYYVPEGDDPADHRDEVMRRMRRKADIAESEGVTLLLENEKELYGDTPGRVRDVLTAVDSPNLRCLFDPANFLEIGERSYPDALLQLVEFVEYLHVKDAVYGERGEMRATGEGDGRIAETLAALRDRGFTGTLALEPHLAEAGEAGGYSGDEAFRVAIHALEDALDEIDASYA
ncbi:MAG: sugar phosphate isomerase/epimerase family protein [Halobacteriaceae archaeon]